MQALCICAQLGLGLWVALPGSGRPPLLLAYLGVSAVIALCQAAALVLHLWHVVAGQAPAARCVHVRFLLAAKAHYLAEALSMRLLFWPAWGDRLQPMGFCLGPKGVQADLDQQTTFHVASRRWKPFIQGMYAPDQAAPRLRVSAGTGNGAQQRAVLLVFLCLPSDFPPDSILISNLVSLLPDLLGEEQLVAHDAAMALYSLLQRSSDAARDAALSKLQDTGLLRELCERLCRCCCQFLADGFSSPAPMCALYAVLQNRPGSQGLCIDGLIQIEQAAAAPGWSSPEHTRQHVWVALLFTYLVPQWTPHLQTLCQTLSQFAPAEQDHCRHGTSYVYVADLKLFRDRYRAALDHGQELKLNELIGAEEV